MDPEQAVIPRRQALVGGGVAVGAGVLVACSRGQDRPAPPAREDGVLAGTADVPVGSALIVDGIVLTQARAGEFAGFSAVCPHKGCEVSEVDGAEVICPCHHSIFGLDGAVISGPAREPLAPAAITVRGESIVAG
ncbi:Rieske (2Fe-2S) protein [Mycobacterium sp. AMU20-3851]|uniref:QcrA and Rieske domain-containing protein n=1 Tax=Mycobacterium sp. AMU20-3851 TaxID=3122055 RepID=UPI0037551311